MFYLPVIKVIRGAQAVILYIALQRLNFYLSTALMAKISQIGAICIIKKESATLSWPRNRRSIYIDFDDFS